jgi:endonuclease/exonuclease/phosphatase family metal-dependent hydrolase
MFMNKLFSFLLSLVFISIAHAQIRIVNYNIAKLQGDQAALKEVLALASEDDSCGEALSVSIFVFQEVSQGNQKELHQLLGDTYSMGTYTNQGEPGGAQAMFYKSTQLIEKVASHEDIFTGAGRYADRWELHGVGENKGVHLWMYSTHLKASKGSSNKDQRLIGANAILENIKTLPEDANVIVVGDMNFYTNKELAYQAFIEILIDPLGTEEWAGEDNAIKHTQSPRKVRKGGLIHGGLDDRFDFQFISKSLQDGKGLDIIVGSYHAFGNDGKHYDEAINEQGKPYFKDNEELANALHSASDHIPVMADYEIKKKKVETSNKTQAKQ